MSRVNHRRVAYMRESFQSFHQYGGVMSQMNEACRGVMSQMNEACGGVMSQMNEACAGIAERIAFACMLHVTCHGVMSHV